MCRPHKYGVACLSRSEHLHNHRETPTFRCASPNGACNHGEGNAATGSQHIQATTPCDDASPQHTHSTAAAIRNAAAAAQGCCSLIRPPSVTPKCSAPPLRLSCPQHQSRSLLGTPWAGPQGPPRRQEQPRQPGHRRPCPRHPRESWGTCWERRRRAPPPLVPTA